MKKHPQIDFSRGISPSQRLQKDPFPREKWNTHVAHRTMGLGGPGKLPIPVFYGIYSSSSLQPEFAGFLTSYAAQLSVE